MADSKIEWTDTVWNPVTGCTRVSAGCDHCYAVVQSNIRGSNPHPVMQRKYTGLTVLNKAGDRHFNGVVRTHEDALTIPMRWKKPRKIFVNSMSDLFHKDVPFAFIDKVFAIMALCPQHTFQVLTKRPERMAEYLIDSRDVLGNKTDERVNVEAEDIGGATDRRFLWPLPNVWLGTSVEDQASYDERRHHLAECHAAVRFYSIEPMIGAIDLGDDFYESGNRVDWVIVGGESGPAARECNVNWIRSIVEHCKAADVACFVKQLGARPIGDANCPIDCPCSLHYGFSDPKGGDIDEFPAGLRLRQFPVALERMKSARRMR